MKTSLRLASVLLICSALSGCDTEYWWSRGQPPTVETLLSRSEAKLNGSLHKRASTRADIAPTAEKIRDSLRAAIAGVDTRDSSVADRLRETQDAFDSLEGKLSWGNRPPYGELAGQLRVFVQAATGGETLYREPLELFSARAFFFLASELDVPKVAPAS